MSNSHDSDSEVPPGNGDHAGLGCTVRLRGLAASPDDLEEAREQPVEETCHPRSMDDLIAYLTGVRDRHVTDMADRRAESIDPMPIDSGEALGGFGVEITNRWGSVVEVAAGADAWFLYRHRPSPGRSYSDRSPIDGTRVFYLDGGHYTEMESGELASREGCLRTLRIWLETDEFPEPKSAARSSECSE